MRARALLRFPRAVPDYEIRCVNATAGRLSRHSGARRRRIRTGDRAAPQVAAADMTPFLILAFLGGVCAEGLSEDGALVAEGRASKKYALLKKQSPAIEHTHYRAAACSGILTETRTEL
ncbi:hypothetical protein EVAR_66241_1 [Eumeta japonica]|uniref:Uncharacterized protein n=1 Tax=Eumeta variegata TaxID=151549 RepID=A0A4C1ZSS4_EUMVA|nr:hypothetical protein EVAR_66241_1 [Eumeta japonica]